MVQLYKIINKGYANDGSNIRNYIRDNKMSNKNEQIYFNPKKNKLLFNVSGTHNMSDVLTDVNLAAGNLKNTDRYKEAFQALERSKNKYNPKTTTLTGHSLGGAIVQDLSVKNSNDKSYAYNSGYSLFNLPYSNKNLNSFRTAGDPVSILGSLSNNVKTLKNQNKAEFNPFRRPLLYGLETGLKAHSSSNLKNNNVRI
jgi:hypothetical protein